MCFGILVWQTDQISVFGWAKQKTSRNKLHRKAFSNLKQNEKQEQKMIDDERGKGKKGIQSGNLKFLKKIEKYQKYR